MGGHFLCCGGSPADSHNKQHTADPLTASDREQNKISLYEPSPTPS